MIGIELESIRGILSLYGRALAGRNLQILPTSELIARGIGWTAVDEPTTEGATIFVPSLVADFASPRDDFDYYKVLVAHQAGHLEFGSFDFRLNRPSSIFADCRPLLVADHPSSPITTSDYEAFFDLFADRHLASDLFTVVEDARIDYLLAREYKGIRQAHRRAQIYSAERRTPLPLLPLRDAFLEAMVQVTLGADLIFAFPTRHIGPLREAAGVLRLVTRDCPLVEDSAEATIRLYCIVAEVPNVQMDGLPTVLVDCRALAGEPEPPGEDDLHRWIERFRAIRQSPPSSDTDEEKPRELPYRGLDEVRFRGGFKPELVQAFGRLRQTEASANRAGQSVSAESLRRLLNKSVEFEMEDRDRLLDPQHDIVVESLLKLQGRAKRPPSRTRRSSQPRSRGSREGGKAAELSFYYDEWDYLANEYRSAWCHLRQKYMSEGSLKFYEDTLRDRYSLLAEVRRQFATLRPEGLKRRRGLQDGEEVDFDAVIEAVADRRAGVTPSDKLYRHRRKSQRDVAVAILLDMSASTGERIREGPPSSPRIQAGSNLGPGDKRIIDVEKEGLVLLANALESIGDRYGIYGFSGTGRDNVQFYVIKDVDESFAERVKRRMDSIVPIQGTRMGPAIRHSVAILERQEAKTRILILVSDGRPQDADYGSDAGAITHVIHPYLGAMEVQSAEDELRERDYAINDTKMALVEARRKGIVPFCLSIDKLGHDYLRAMCGDIGYEVLADVTALPRKLPSLYRRLTR